jgi:hypothetical protein
MPASQSRVGETFYAARPISLESHTRHHFLCEGYLFFLGLRDVPSDAPEDARRIASQMYDEQSAHDS